MSVLDSFAPAAKAVLSANAARIDRALAQGMRPPPKISVAEWASAHRRFNDDAPLPGPFRNEEAIYLVEPMERMSPYDPASVITLMKCAQSGGSVAAENWIGYVSDVAPGPLMYVQATITAAKDWVAEKFWPMVEASPRLNPERRGSIMPRRSRDGSGTTALRVRFRKGGWMLIAGANSAATLRQHSIRYVVEDDLDQFPDDLDNQGSPESMVDARLTVFARLGISKRVKVSTPTNKGASKIERAYAESDRRRFYFKCQHCGSRFDPIFSDLIWPDGQPEKVELVTPCCGVAVRHSEKRLMSLADGWLATAEIDGATPERVLTEEEFQSWRARDLKGKQPGYHITGIITSFVTWADLCLKFAAAQGDVNKLRAWTNLLLGDAFVLKGDAPPAESLEVLREQDWGRGEVPWGAVVFTLGCDVQGDGIYYEHLGWGPRAETWTIDQGFLPGPTDIAGEGAWARLEELARRSFPMPGGKAFGFDQICVDARYHTDAAKAFCKRSGRRMPVFGEDGWSRPILGRGKAIDFSGAKSNRPRRGARKRKKAGEEAHLVGTFGAKLAFMGYLKASITFVEAQLKGQRPEAVRGRMHFNRDCNAAYFDMLTSESCVVEVKNGQPRRVWKVESGRENHLLDCRIYNLAAAEALALDAMSDIDWELLREVRYASADPNQGDLIALANRPSASSSSAEQHDAETAKAGGGFIDAGEDYL